jgi:protein SCO1/2
MGIWRKSWVLVLIALSGLALVACLPGVSSGPARVEAQPHPAPEFSLTSQDNHTVSLSQLRGKVVLMDFIYTSCVDACPALQAVMDKVRRDLGKAFPEQVNLVTITFDPQYDTPQVMKEYATRAGWDMPGWYFLTGSQEKVARVNDAYGSIYRRVEPEGMAEGQDNRGGHHHRRNFQHNTLIVLIDQQGMLQKRYPAPHLGSSARIVEDVRALLEAGGKRL